LAGTMDRRGAYRIFCGETPKEKNTVGRLRRRWDNGNKMERRGMDWIDVVFNKKR